MPISDNRAGDSTSAFHPKRTVAAANVCYRISMKLFPTLFACALVTAFANGARAADPIGLFRYTNLRYIAEADDYVGLNLGISTGQAPVVSYELCEGWCHGPLTFPAKIENGVIRFTVKQELVDQAGNAASPLVYRVEARLVRTLLGRRIIVTSPDNRDFYQVLKPAKGAH